MSGKHIWKLALSALIVAFSVSYLIPLTDTPFEDYLKEVKHDDSEFLELVERADEMAKTPENGIGSVYMALKAMTKEEKIDLGSYFPEIPIEHTLKNPDKRNQLLLEELKRQSEASLKQGLDIKGGISISYQADPEQLGVGYEREDRLAKAIEIIEQRVNTYGVSEPIVRAVGDSRIEVQIAGVTTEDDPNLVDNIGKPAKLTFHEIHRTARPGIGKKPFGYKAMVLTNDSGDELYEENLYVKEIPALKGNLVETAYATPNELGTNYQVSLNFNSEGAKLFGDITTQLAPSQNRPGGRLGIVLDKKLQSAPTVQGAITGGRAQITGNFTQREANGLANVLNNPLDIELEVAEMYEVGPTLAKDSINSGIKAAMIGASCVAVFMIFYYMFGGFVALVSVALNIVVVLGALASFDATLTLPGIAGIILTVGMAVDANILIFERIREELKSGKSLKSSLVGGFEKVFSTIFDANVTTLIVSIVMVSFGTGPVKGFGLTLAIGVMSTMFCALIVSRVLLEVMIETDALKKFAMLAIVKNPKVQFLKMWKPAFVISWTIVVIGISVVAMKWDSIWGIDFTGGDEITMSFVEKVDEGKIRSLLTDNEFGEVNPQYFKPLGEDQEILKIQTKFKKGAMVADALALGFPSAKFEKIGESQVGPTVGSEIQLNALKAIGISLGLILLYIAFRFEVGYGVGAVVATLHDILLTVGIFVLGGHQFTAPMVAAILLIVGYSLNDTIVLFDRIREELLLRPTAKLKEVINIAINAVLSRSLLTSITTLLAAVSLMIWGTGVINDIAFTFTIGIITGTFSSIFIASPVFYWWHKGDRRSVEHSHDIAPEYDWQASSKASNEGAS